MTANRTTGAQTTDRISRSDEGVPRAGRPLDRLPVLVGTVPAGILLAGFVISLIGICLVRHPWDGWSDNLVLDAKAVATGHLQYGNPAKQFVGEPYPPLFTFVFAGLLKLYWWEGWGPILSMVAAAMAIISMISMLWTKVRRWESRVVAASAVVALSLGGLSALPVTNGLFEARPDQLAWGLVVVAGTLTFRGLLAPSGMSRKQMIMIGLLLTASIFCKQTTIVPCLVVALLASVIPVVASAGRRRWRDRFISATVPVTFVSSSVLLGIVLLIASHGWSDDLLIDLPLRYARVVPLGSQAGTSLRLLTVPLVLFVGLGLCVARTMVVHREQYRRREIIVAIGAAILALSPIPSAILAEAKLGGEPNQLAGPVWMLTLGSAVLLLLLRPSTRQVAATAIACLVLVTGIDPLSHLMADQHLGVPNLVQRASWVGIDPFLLATVNKGEAISDQSYPSLSVTPKRPGYPEGDYYDILAGGYTPRWFTDNLLTGKYALVRGFYDYLFRFFTPSIGAYTSDEGQYDESVLWKYDLLLQMGYAPVKDPDSGVVYYKPRPQLKRLGWFAQCFGPYQARDAGLEVRLRGTGGLVCIDRGDLHLSRAPGPTTDVVMTLHDGKGDATVRFAATPHTLRITPLNTKDQPSASGSNIDRAGSAASRCLVRDSAKTTVTLRAVEGSGGLRCDTTGRTPVLELPVNDGTPNAHVLIHMAAADSPTIVAVSTSGAAAPFTLLNLTPADINAL